MWFFIVVFAVVAADQITKLLIVGTFALFESVAVVPGLFNLTYVVNKGAAFSILAHVDSWWRQPFFVGIGIVATVALTVVAMRIRKESLLQALSLALITGGALGNLIDRIRLGAVIDFLDFYVSGYHWPAFNLADSAICLGVAFFLIFNFRKSNGKQQPEVKR